MERPYTEEDIYELRKIYLSGRYLNIGINNILSSLEGYGHYGTSFVEEVRFVFYTPFKDIPKYVGNLKLKPFIEWRLKIGK